MKRWRMQVLYSGRVQGVGFRYQTKRQATGFELSGTVRNLLDGRVELIAEGERSELEEFRKAIRDDPQRRRDMGRGHGRFPGFRDRAVNENEVRHHS
jgi:acylphosphatase